MSTVMYGLYKGDRFLDVGTAEELARRFGVKPHSIRKMAEKPEEGKGNRRVAVRFTL